MKAVTSIATLLIMGTTGAPCRAQTAGYPNLGFRSYSNVAQRSYNSGIAGRTTNNSFNTGFSGLSQASNNMQYSQPTRPYSTHYSAAAASSLVHQVTSIWGRTTAGMMMSQPQQQGMTPYQQSPVQPQQGMAQVQQAYAQPAPTMNGLLPPISRQQMLRVFLEGGTPQSAGGGFAPVPNGGSYAATRTAYCNYQTAENEARKARNAASRARYDKDRWNRNNDASQAEYAANNANYAAQRAESAAYTADSQAGEYANLARQAANRARQDANQARYNANTGP